MGAMGVMKSAKNLQWVPGTQPGNKFKILGFKTDMIFESKMNTLKDKTSQALVLWNF